jgi:hypothetical protein
MRNIAYGTLANAIIHTTVGENTYEGIYFTQVLKEAESYPMLRCIPIRYCVPIEQGGLFFSWDRCTGGLVCLGLTFITALTSAILIGLY